MRKPRGLGTAGSKLWERVTEVYDLDEIPQSLEILEQACKVSDQISELEKAAKGLPFIVPGSAGQQTINPLISEVRFQRGLLVSLLSKLNFTEEE